MHCRHVLQEQMDLRPIEKNNPENMFLETTVYIYWNTYMKFIDGFLLQTRQKDASC